MYQKRHPMRVQPWQKGRKRQKATCSREIDAFDDLVAYINYLPPRVSVTIVWNKHLPHFDSTREQQGYKAFAVLPSDLPFIYGSLTVQRASFRPWL